MNKKNVSIALNLLIVVMEIAALIMILSLEKKISFEYYTVDSNILAIFSSLLYVVFSIKGRVPRWVEIFKYMTTICLLVTFLVVILILAPMYNFAYGYVLFYNALVFQHLLCPVIAVITFLVFDDIKIFKFKDSVVGCGLTVLYGVILTTLNILKLVDGPYPFLKVYDQPIYMTIIWFIVIIGISLLVAFILRKCRIKINKN